MGSLAKEDAMTHPGKRDHKTVMINPRNVDEIRNKIEYGYQTRVKHNPAHNLTDEQVRVYELCSVCEGSGSILQRVLIQEGYETDQDDPSGHLGSDGKPLKLHITVYDRGNDEGSLFGHPCGRCNTAVRNMHYAPMDAAMSNEYENPTRHWQDT